MADLATLNTRLADAEAARHALATGQRVVEVMKDGRRVRYQESNKGDLWAYIGELKAEIAGLEADEGSRPRRRPIGLAWTN